MYVAVVPNRGSPPAILLRESYREGGKTKNRTLANLSRLAAESIEQLRAVLRGDQLLPAAAAVEIVRALPHGHVLAALGTPSGSTPCFLARGRNAVGLQPTSLTRGAIWRWP